MKNVPVEHTYTVTVQVISVWLTVFYSCVLAAAVGMGCFFMYAACCADKGAKEEHKLNLISLNETDNELTSERQTMN